MKRLGTPFAGVYVLNPLMLSFHIDAARCALRVGVLAAGLCGLVLAGCEQTEETPRPEAVRPVRVATAETLPGGETVSLSGSVQAREDVALSFRIGGQLIERSVNVGDQVQRGQVVARLDPSTRRDAVDAARANLAAAMTRLVEARNTVERYEPMLPRGFVARAQFDRAVEARDAAQAQVDAAQAQVNSAETQLRYADLVADGPGTVTARLAEPGEVVAAGQPIIRLAREGGRDAVFDVPARVKDAAPADVDVEVVLSTDPRVRTTGRVREVSPQADPVTRTFQVRVGLADPPAAMRLGSTVTGRVHLGGDAGIMVPGSALTSAAGAPAVWVVEPQTRTVQLRNVDVARFELDRVLLTQGLDDGELVVTAGVQALRPGQRVRLPGEPAEQVAAAEPEPTRGKPDNGDTAGGDAPAASDDSAAASSAEGGSGSETEPETGAEPATGAPR